MNENHLDRGNVFDHIPTDHSVEHFDTVAKLNGGKVERIVTFGQRSSERSWYDQDQNEWVLVLRGRAKLEIEGFRKPVELKPGDYVNIPAHSRHRVAWTSQDEPTIWLAIHY